MEKFICIFGNYKKSFCFFLLLLFSFANLFATGSLITTRNYYFFQKPDINSKKYYIPRYQVFTVLDIKKNEQGEYFFLVEANVVKEKKPGTGLIYTPITTNQEQVVQLFSSLPKQGESFIYHQVPLIELKINKEQLILKNFPFLTWHKVEYNLDIPEQVWAVESAIIYRYSQSSQWLSKKFSETLKENISRNKRNAILAGNIEENFSEKEVLLTLGVPMKSIQKDGITQLQYQYRKIILENDKVTQVVIEKK